MAKSLVIVESPAKAKTINKYLGPDFEVKASMGHVRDLPSKGLNVDIENDFAPTYDIMPGKKRTVAALKAAVKKCDRLFLATDLDREGEAIAWHLAQILRVPEDKTFRVIFNAITKSTIQDAFAKPGKLDIDKVMAQQARRILDRIVGYKISPLLWRKVTPRLSAGRVQSVAVKMVVEKEREIRRFKPVEYWRIPALFSTDLKSPLPDQWRAFMGAKSEGDAPPTLADQDKWLAEHDAFRAELSEVGDKKFQASSRQEAEPLFNALQKARFTIAGIETRESVSQPPAPFITSTLQQAAANRLGFPTKKTMATAQQLYEGIDLGSMGSLGLITYMRTDSTHLTGEAIKDVRRYIGRHIGPDYLPKEPAVYASAKAAQQAHEAIRPTDVDLTPSDIKQFLTPAQSKLYELIWQRFVACQMKPAKWNVTNLDIAADTSFGCCRYRATGRVLVFDGFTKIWKIASGEQQLPQVKAQQPLAVVDIKAEQHFTKPPARYTEGGLVKALEKEGIGRPSTYAAIISTIQERKYVEQKDKKFFATDLGEIVTDKLNEYFPNIMDIAFTRFMEEQLDKIEEQHIDWLGVLKDFYGPFKKSLETAQKQMKHAKAETSPSEYDCPQCGRQLVYKFGRNGKFLSCSDYPNCKFACPCDKEGKMVEEKLSEHKCPVCGKPLVHKSGRFGPFLGCSDYPACKTIVKLDKEGNIVPPKPPPEPTGISCHKCKQGRLVVRESKKGPFLGCSRFPKCRTIISIEQLDHLKDLQAAGKWPPETPEQADQILGRAKSKKTAAAGK
ncbi:MAG: type I DNA topoisomerase [Phycisphaerales bacterium]|nr:MAG: type I DNA topoisomerase [Phycisphaerales bacterium]